MKNKSKEGFFWTSYSDLMTTLFFVMLVLFVLALALLHNKVVEEHKVRVATETQLKKIKQINDIVKSIDKEYFEYDSQYKRFVLKHPEKISFNKGSCDINDIEDQSYLVRAGSAIRKFALDANAKTGAEYFIVIEGQSSNDNYDKNDELSYNRALALMNFWKDKKCIKRHVKGVYEVIISGSGAQSSFRDQSDESKNQRFVIYIIPKPGEWAVSD